MSSSSPVATAASALASGARRLAASCWHHGTISTMWALRALRGLIGLIVAAWSVLLIAWLALYWGILPHIEQWRPQIESRASQALGVPVRIGHIEVRSGGWVPALDLRDVVLLDPQDHEALRLPHMVAAVSARSLLALQLRFEQLLIEQPELEVRRDARGRVWVAGLEVSTGGSQATDAPDPVMDWLFDQGEFVIRGGAVRWIDEQRGAPPLALSAVDLVLRNGLRRHDLRLDATPPADWGERFSLRARMLAPLLSRGNDWREWSGTLYADLPRVRVPDLHHHVSLPFHIDEGEGALRAWLDVDHGTPRGATVDLALRQVSLQLAEAAQPLHLEQLEGRLTGARDADGLSLSALNFGFVTWDGVRWPRSDMSLVLREHRRAASPSTPAAGASSDWIGDIVGGDFSAQRLDLALMAQIASRIPLPEAVRTILAESEPRGVVSGLVGRWDGPVSQPRRYQVRAQVGGLSLAAKPSADPSRPGRPGWRNADIALQASEKGGDATLVIRDGALDFPGIFADRMVALDEFDAKLSWRIEPAPQGAAPAIELKVHDARFSNADAHGEAEATWTTGRGSGVGRGGRFPGRLDLSGKLTQGRATSTARYLPLAIPDGARRYVAQAVRSGTLTGVSFKVKGDLWDFPFSAGRPGEFRIAGHIDGANFAYVPDEAQTWPAFANVSADLVFDRVSMEIRNAQAQVFGVGLSQVQGGIRDFGKNPTLAIEGQARGPLAEMVHYVNASPVGRWIHDAMAQTTAGGSAELRLALSLPLDRLDDSTVKGSVTLAGNDVRLRPDVPLFGGARGRVDFTHKGLTINGGGASILGGDASFDGGTQPDGSLRFTGQGVATADGLRHAGELGWPSRLGAALNGQAAYRMTLALAQGEPEITLSSNLVGLSVDLPPPLRKAADTPLPMRFQNTLSQDAAAGGALRERQRLELGNVVQAEFMRDLSRDTPRVLRGGIGIFEPAPQPDSGVAVNISVPQFNVDAWSAQAARLFGPAAGPGAPAGKAESGSDGYMPNNIAVRAQELTLSSRTLTHVVAGLSRELPTDTPGADTTWHANLDSDQLGGYVAFRPSRSGAGPGRVFARLSHLSLPKAEVERVDSLLDQSAASSVPALDIEVDDFELRGKHLGRVEIEAVNRREEGGGRLWRLSKFNMIAPEARLSGSGEWGAVPGNPRRRMVLDFKLDLADSGAYLQRVLGERSLRGGKGRLQGQLSWSGSPWSLDYPSLSGQVNVELESGQFLKAEPGAARLLGVLSLQALPRRLALDFRDVFQEGFAFDSVTGDVKIDGGQASTNNLRMRGVQAAVLMEGRADLQQETQDLRVVIVPEINAGTASLAYAAINPALGLGTFLAQLVLRKPIIAASTREFHVSGSWVDPKIDRVERKSGGPLPDTEAPAPATPKS
jgi:uncharacterized protein (TIGR02099 family)